MPASKGAKSMTELEMAVRATETMEKVLAFAVREQRIDEEDLC